MLQSSKRSPVRFRSFSQPQYNDGLIASPHGSQPSNTYAPTNFPASQPISGHVGRAASDAHPLKPIRRLLQPSPQPQNFFQPGPQSSQSPSYANAANPQSVAQAKVAGPRNLQFNVATNFAQQTNPLGTLSQHSPQQPFPTSQMQSKLRLDSTQQTHYQHSRLGLNRFTQEPGSQEFPQPARNAQDRPHQSPLQSDHYKSDSACHSKESTGS